MFFIVGISLICVLWLQFHIETNSPTYLTSDLKTAKSTSLKDAYYNNDDQLLGLSDNRRQVTYDSPKIINIIKSGNISLLTFYNTESESKQSVAMTKTDWTKELRNNARINTALKPYRAMRKWANIVCVVSFVIMLMIILFDEPNRSEQKVVKE